MSSYACRQFRVNTKFTRHLEEDSNEIENTIRCGGLSFNSDQGSKSKLDIANDSMKRSSIYGIALIVGAVGGVVTMMFHPTSRDLVGPIDQIARRNEIITVATHALALISIPISFFGVLGLSRLLSLDRLLVSAALVFYSFAAVAAMCAAVASGLIAPVITRQ